MAATHLPEDAFARLRRSIVGVDREVPVLGAAAGPARRRYINFDNAATTPPFREVKDTVDEFLDWYSSIHRGTGFKSLLSTWVFEECRRRIARFVGADPRKDTVIFTKNTTEAVNKLSRRMLFKPGEAVLVSGLEHHSNDLPWRKAAGENIVRLPVDTQGNVDLAATDETLRREGGRIRLVALSGASNVTGSLPPINEVARLAHKHGAQMFVDAAQLAPHRKIDMRPAAREDHIDYLAFSAHKMYAPFGTGVLVGPRALFDEGEPDHVGGGTVDLVTTKRAYWTEPPEKEEAGTPNVIGALALARAIAVLESVGMDAIADHERRLTAHALRRLREVPGLDLYGDTDPALPRDRVGVIPFNVRGMDCALTSAVMAHEGGIGVRHGCFCAHPFISFLLHVDEGGADDLVRLIELGDRTKLPGLVRISFGVYNTESEVDEVVAFLAELARRGPRAEYVQIRETGEYYPRGYKPDFAPYFNF